jgi:AbrB family looped-hinge helix DNA binding protein
MEIHMDNDGKITIPKGIRTSLGIHVGDSFQIETTTKGILLTPFHVKKRVDEESVIVLSGNQEGDTRLFTL